MFIQDKTFQYKRSTATNNDPSFFSHLVTRFIPCINREKMKKWLCSLAAQNLLQTNWSFSKLFASSNCSLFSTNILHNFVTFSDALCCLSKQQFFMIVVAIQRKVLKGAGSRNVNKLPLSDVFAVFWMGHITEIFRHFSQHGGVSLKMDSLRRKTNETKQSILYDC